MVMCTRYLETRLLEAGYSTVSTSKSLTLVSSILTVGTFADNRKEAEATLTQLHNEKLQRNAPAAEPAPRQELRDNLLQNIPEDGISAAQLSEQVGQEEGNFRDLLDQMEEDGDILSELTPDGERYFPASSDLSSSKRVRSIYFKTPGGRPPEKHP